MIPKKNLPALAGLDTVKLGQSDSGYWDMFETFGTNSSGTVSCGSVFNKTAKLTFKNLAGYEKVPVILIRFHS